LYLQLDAERQQVLFITPAKNAKEAKDYFTRHMATSDYYLRDAAEFAGEWHGLGAELLGLSGTIDKESYFKLCDNINPKTGEQLTPITRSERRVLYDFTFDAPKSVTLAYELAGDERIMDAFRSAVKDTMSEMEGAMLARVRTQGRSEDRASANMVWGEFIHRTTRPVDGHPDPHLHVHAVAFNSTWDPQEERWKAAQFSNLVRDRGYYQASFHSRFAERLTKLGYGIERDKNSFRLIGIDRETVDKFSRRTAIIEAEAQRLGIIDPDAKDQLGRRTREQKNELELSLSELRKIWMGKLSDEERDAISGARQGQQTNSLDAGDATDYAVSHCFTRESAVPEKELLKMALIHSVGNASVNDVRGEMAGRDNILRKEKAGIRYATTREVLAEELEMSAFVRNGRGKRFKLGGTEPIVLDEKLSKEQREAALVILNSRDTVTALKGGAGTGKTSMIKETVKAINKTGKEVLTFAPSADASKNTMRSEGFKEADTVERFLIDPEMQARARNQVIWVDEAGLLSVVDMKRLFDVAKAQDARVVLSGDTAQHTGVKRGDALRILERDSGIKTAELKEIRRQTNETYRAAVKAISEGDTLGKDGRTRLEAGMEILDGMGAIVEVEGEDRYRKIAADYAAVTAERKADGKFKSALVVSPTHKEAESVTEAIRSELRAQGRLGEKDRQFLSLRPLNLTEAQKGDKSEYSSGSVVQFVQNAKGFKRGERLIVESSSKDGVRARREDGSAAMIPLNETARFQVYEAKQVALAQGDKIRVTINGFVPREARPGLAGNKSKDRLDNGAVYEVDGFTRKGDIRLNNGFVIPKNYGGISHGFVVTSHASQGKTVDVALVALGSESFPAATREQAYVSISRGKEAVRLYTDNKAEMLDAIKSSAARLSATELMQSVPLKHKPGYLQRLFRSGAIQRAYTAMRLRMAARPEIHRQREGMSHGI
jgi:conjugative relaxase-like TrwC/TraI family protein